MEVRVKYKELDNISKDTINNSLLLEDKLLILEDEIKKLRENWQGVDADTFYESITLYLNDLKKIPLFYQDISNVIDNMNTNYQDTDNNYLNTLKRGVVLDEDYNNK
jgi:WXG100 family type VII secretion target